MCYVTSGGRRGSATSRRAKCAGRGPRGRKAYITKLLRKERYGNNRKGRGGRNTPTHCNTRITYDGTHDTEKTNEVKRMRIMKVQRRYD